MSSPDDEDEARRVLAEAARDLAEKLAPLAHRPGLEVAVQIPGGRLVVSVTPPPPPPAATATEAEKPRRGRGRPTSTVDTNECALAIMGVMRGLSPHLAYSSAYVHERVNERLECSTATVKRWLSALAEAGQLEAHPRGYSMPGGRSLFSHLDDPQA
jgi:hypothetical protein